MTNDFPTRMLLATNGSEKAELALRTTNLAGSIGSEMHVVHVFPMDEGIVKLGEELSVDLVVVGNRGLGGIRRALMGESPHGRRRQPGRPPRPLPGIVVC